MMKKLISITLALLLLCVAPIQGALGELLIPDTALADAGEPVNLVFLRAGTDENGRDFWMGVIEEYTQAHPNVTIEYQEAPWGNDIETKLNTAFASGTAPDVLSFNIASLGQRVPLGQYEPLDSYFETWEGKDDLMESMKQIGMVGDTLYGMTYGPNPSVFCWREDLFEQAGLDPKAPPTSWEELLDYHKKLTVQQDGETVQVGYSMATTGTNSYQPLQTLMMQNGVANFVDEATNELLFNSPEGVEALDLVRQIAEVGYIPFNNDNADNDPFLKGQSAMAYLNVANYNKAIANEEWGQHVRVVGPMGKEAVADFCGANLFYITSQSKNKDAAWDFVAFNMTPDTLWKSFDAIGSPVVRKSMEADFVAKNPELNAAIFAAVGAGTGVAKVPYIWSVLSSIVTALEKTILGEASPADALQEAYEASQAEIDSL